MTIGSAKYSYSVEHFAKEGYFPIRKSTAGIEFVRTGKTRFVFHLNPSCEKVSPKSKSNVTVTITEHNTHLVYGGSLCKLCAGSFKGRESLPVCIKTEYAIFADARTLTRPFRWAEYKSRYQPVDPYDNVPVTENMLLELAAFIEKFIADNPDRGYLSSLHAELTRIDKEWREILDPNVSSNRPDPHQEVIDWQRSEGYPQIKGTPAQVRWAEQLRYEALTFDKYAWDSLDTMACRERDANVWIALRDVEPYHLEQEWLDLKERETDRLRDRCASVGARGRYRSYDEDDYDY